MTHAQSFHGSRPGFALRREAIGDMGVFAHVTDTEGKRIGLHAAA